MNTYEKITEEVNVDHMLEVASGLAKWERLSGSDEEYEAFKWLEKHDHVMVIAWIYVLTLIIVITFAIEIGQKVTGTGNMEFADIVMGVFGFIVMFLVFSVVRGIYKLIRNLIRGDRKDE